MKTTALVNQDENIHIYRNGECHQIVFSLFIFAESKPFQFICKIIKLFMKFGGPPLWPSGQSSWLQMQGLEGGSLSLVSTIEELLERKVAALVYYGYRDQLALTSPTSGSHSVDIVLSCTKAMEFFFVCSSNFGG
jgi:hypothetical protein